MNDPVAKPELVLEKNVPSFSGVCGPREGKLSRVSLAGACYKIWKARGRPASRRTSSTVDVLALRHPLQWDGGDGGTMEDAATSELVKCLLFIMNDEDDPKLSAIDNKRRRYARILWAIAKIGYDNKLPQLGIYIASLGVALEDLIRGVTDPLFVTKGSKRKGSKRDSMLRWGARLQAALGVECFILSGLSRKEAAADAAKYKELARLKRGENRDLEGSLLSWYDRYVEGRVPVPELLEAFQTTRREIRAASLSPAEYRRRGKQAFEQAVKSAIR